MIGEDKLVHFSGVALGEACTIVLRGASAPLPARTRVAVSPVRSASPCRWSQKVWCVCMRPHVLWARLPHDGS